MCHHREPRRGFTLVELLVVISIIAMLIALLLPALKSAREAARQSACLSNQRQLVMAAYAYHSDYKALAATGYDSTPWQGNADYLWYQMPLMGPYIGADIPRDPREGGGSTGNKIAPLGTIVGCPSDSTRSDPLDSWIAYNGEMCRDWAEAALPPGHPYRSSPYWSGPPIDKIKTTPSTLALFEDGHSASFLYVTHIPFKSGAGDVSTSSATSDYRHGGGVNYGFLDGHAQHFADPERAYIVERTLDQDPGKF